MRFNPLLIPAVLVGVSFFWLGHAAYNRMAKARVILLGVGVILAGPAVLFALYYLHLFDNAVWFYEFRSLRFTEVLAGGIGLIAGTLFAWQSPDSWGERLVLPTVAAALIVTPFIKPILSPLDLSKLRDRCDGEVCMQSTFSTCGPASAATLMKTFGIAASEKELATEGFTYQGGTESWYLAREFRRRGLTANFVVRSGSSIEIPAPAVAGVVLPGGAGHFVAITNNAQGRITVADPLKGKLQLPISELQHYYHFTGLFLAVGKK